MSGIQGTGIYWRLSDLAIAYGSSVSNYRLYVY